MKRAGTYERLQYALAWIRGRIDSSPRAGIILGSGLGSLAERLASPTVIPYGEIPEFPIARVAGHTGQLVVGEIASKSGPVTIAAMQGRAHAYEGWSVQDVAFGARVLCMLGIRLLVVTNASGSVNPDLEPGEILRIVDHMNLTGSNPLTGPHDERLGPRFPDLTHAYDERLGEVLRAVADRLGIRLASGVYAWMPGPSYETPAEVRMLRGLGADVVGMSTVPEVIVARHMGVPVVGISLVTNRGAGMAGKPLDHADVAAIGTREGEKLWKLLETYLAEVA